MKAGILAIGSELLAPERVETNAAWLTGRLRELGVEVVLRLTVADDPGVLREAFATAHRTCDLVVATGGLGPTADDLTREAAAAALGRGLHRDEGWVEHLRRRFASFGRDMPAVNEKQGDLLEGATLVRNERGTAPAQWLEADGRLLFLLPGPPREMEPLFDEQVAPFLRARAGGRVLLRRVLKIAGLGESHVEERVAEVYTRVENPRTTILGAPGQVELHLTAEAQDEAEAGELLEELSVKLRERLGERVFSEDGRELPEVVVGLLRDRGLRVAVAESCTGGLLSRMLTDVPGASAVFDRGVVVYSNHSKTELAGVAAETIDRHGAVSAEVASALAAGIRARSGADVGIGITGIAGPEGGSEDKPVGLVFIALDGAAGAQERRAVFPGDRERVRLQSARGALDMLRRGLLKPAPER